MPGRESRTDWTNGRRLRSAPHTAARRQDPVSDAHGSGDAADYRARLREALRRYRRAAGTAPGPKALDPARPEVQRAYRAFAHAALAIPFRPGLGEELALRLGQKPVLRLHTAPAGAEALAANFGQLGYRTLARPVRRRESGIDGLLTDAAPLDDHGLVLFYAGRSADDLEEAAALDAVLLTPPGAGRDEAERLRTGAAATRRLGALLGYPACCAEAFAAAWPVADNAGPIAAAAARTARFDPRLDNLSLGVCHLTAWFACRYDCPPSLEAAAAVEGALAAQDAAGVAQLRRFLAMPRLYVDDRRQLILDGELEAPDRVRLRAVHSPYAFDRDPAEAAYEWVFFADVAAPLLEGGTLTVKPDELVLKRPRRAPLARPRPAGSIWLPFGAPSPVPHGH
jgi:hypothetical protein